MGGTGTGSINISRSGYWRDKLRANVTVLIMSSTADVIGASTAIANYLENAPLRDYIAPAIAFGLGTTAIVGTIHLLREDRGDMALLLRNSI